MQPPPAPCIPPPPFSYNYQNPLPNQQQQTMLASTSSNQSSPSTVFTMGKNFSDNRNNSSGDVVRTICSVRSTVPPFANATRIDTARISVSSENNQNNSRLAENRNHNDNNKYNSDANIGRGRRGSANFVPSSNRGNRGRGRGRSNYFSGNRVEPRNPGFRQIEDFHLLREFQRSIRNDHNVNIVDNCAVDNGRPASRASFGRRRGNGQRSNRIKTNRKYIYDFSRPLPRPGDPPITPTIVSKIDHVVKQDDDDFFQALQKEGVEKQKNEVSGVNEKETKRVIEENRDRQRNHEQKNRKNNKLQNNICESLKIDSTPIVKAEEAFWPRKHANYYYGINRRNQNGNFGDDGSGLEYGPSSSRGYGHSGHRRSRRRRRRRGAGGRGFRFQPTASTSNPLSANNLNENENLIQLDEPQIDDNFDFTSKPTAGGDEFDAHFLSLFSINSSDRENDDDDGEEGKIRRPKHLYSLDDNVLGSLLPKFRDRLLRTRDTIDDVIVATLADDRDRRDHLYSVIKKYFIHLESRFQRYDASSNSSNLTYLNLIDKKVYAYDDFFAFGERFKRFICESKFFTENEISQHCDLMQKYREMLPDEIERLRRKLIELRLDFAEGKWTQDDDDGCDVAIEPFLSSPQQQQDKKCEQEEEEIDNEEQDNDDANDDNRNDDSAIDSKRIKRVNSPTADIAIDRKMITFNMIDPRQLYASLSLLDDVDEQIQYMVSRIALTAEARQHLDRFVFSLNKALQSTRFASLRPRLVRFGSLASGLAMFDADLDLVIEFGDLLHGDDEIRIDFVTAMMALKVVLEIFEKKLALKSNDRTLIGSLRCPIIKLEFFNCFTSAIKDWENKDDDDGDDDDDDDDDNDDDEDGEMETATTIRGIKRIDYNNCDISVNKRYGIFNSKFLRFLAKLDDRFYRMTLILKYWAKRQRFIAPGYFSSYGWTLMIVFYLQCCTPPVFLSLERLQALPGSATNHHRPEHRLHGYRFDYCDDPRTIPRTENTQSVGTLISGFFDFYYSFDYSNCAIAPRLGTIVPKEMLYRQKITTTSAGTERHFRPSYIVIEDPFVVDHNVGSFFRESNKEFWFQVLHETVQVEAISAANCIRVLTDPDLIADDDDLICE